MEAQRFEIDESRLVELLHRQDGVVARRQLLALGATPPDIDRLLRRRDLTRVHTGIYVNHTGPLTPRQREWIAVLVAWPAALTGDSALPGGSRGRVDIAVAHGRTVQLPPWARARRVVDLEGRALMHRSPPRMRTEEALLDRMIDCVGTDDIAHAFAVLAQTVTARATTPERLLAKLEGRKRIRGRRMITEMIMDVRDGVCSVLERGYVQRVERPHGLPRASRQHDSHAGGGLSLQDVRYVEHGLIVELDGSLGHASAAARDADALRDLAEFAVADLLTVRATYGVVFRHGCQASHLIGAILRRQGWDGQVRNCPTCRECDVVGRGSP